MATVEVPNPDCADDLANSKSRLPKRGYSIWSLLVIMTLLAVWLAVPRRIGQSTEPPIYLSFVIVHQLVLWTAMCAFTWLVTGKRRPVAYGAITVVAMMILPLIVLLLETSVAGNNGNLLFSQLLSAMSLHDPYVRMMTEVFGYDF